MVRGKNMGKLAKKYVMVEKDVYDRRFKDSAESHSVKLPNPFQNQNVSRAHSLKKDMFTVLKDTSLSPSEANAMVEDMLSEYRKNFNTVWTIDVLERHVKTYVEDRERSGTPAIYCIFFRAARIINLYIIRKLKSCSLC